MKKLHWLLVESLIKLLVQVCVKKIVPPYLVNLLTSYVTMSEMRQLIIYQPIPNMVISGKRSFACGSPRLWNNLDPTLRKIVFHHRLSNGN